MAGNSVSRMLARLDGSDRTDTCAAAQANTSRLPIGTSIAFIFCLPLRFAARAPGSLRLSSVPPFKAVPEGIRPHQTYTPWETLLLTCMPASTQRRYKEDARFVEMSKRVGKLSHRHSNGSRACAL